MVRSPLAGPLAIIVAVILLANLARVYAPRTDSVCLIYWYRPVFLTFFDYFRVVWHAVWKKWYTFF